MNRVVLVLYIIAFVSESVGIIAIFRQARASTAMLRSGATGIIDGGDVYGHSDILQLGDAAELALTHQAGTWWAIVALGVGMATGTAGNIITL
jgi:hypothetical protein